MHLRALIKLNAKRALQKNWSRAAAVALLLTGVALLFLLLEALLMAVFEVPPTLDSLQTPNIYIDDFPNASPMALLIMICIGTLSYLISAPLDLGALGWFYKLGLGDVDEMSDVFEFFSTWKLTIKAAKIYLCTAIRIACWVVLFCAPGASVVAFSVLFGERALSQPDELLAAGGIAAGTILALGCFLLAMIWCMKYFCVPFLIIKDSHMSLRQAFRKSAKLTAGHRAELFKLECSLLGHHLFGIFVITRMYTVPYIATVRGLYASYLIEMGENIYPAPKKHNWNPFIKERAIKNPAVSSDASVMPEPIE